MSNYDARAGELLAWEAETGLPLPMPVGEILALEDAGAVVDLATGEVWHNLTIASMPALEAMVVIDAMERTQHGQQ